MSYALSLTLQEAKAAQTDFSFRYISGSVILFHVLFIFWMNWQQYEVPKPIKFPEKLIVKTINLSEGGERARQPSSKTVNITGKASESVKKKSEVVSTQSKPKSQPAPVSVKPKPEVKKVEPKKLISNKKVSPKKEIPKKKETSKKEALKKKETVKEVELKKDTIKKESSDKAKPDLKVETTSAKKREFIAKAQASLAKADASRSNLSSISAAGSSSKNLSDTHVSTGIGTLHVDAISSENGSSLSVTEMGYQNELSIRLRSFLKLPEHGDVTIKLKLDRSGRFLSLSIVTFKNDANKKYIEKEVPSLTFPVFGSNFNGHQDYTFLITLSNK